MFHTQILDVTKQAIHSSVTHLTTHTVFACTVIYGSNNPEERALLWENLAQMHDTQMPWLVGGDFNCVLDPNERLGGNPPSRVEIEDFRTCLPK